MLPGAPIAAFSAFGRQMISSWDIDPVYPVLKCILDELDLDRTRAEWLTVLYLAYYELSSAVTAFEEFPDPELDGQELLRDLATLKLPTGIERRGLRDPECMRAHLASWLGVFDGRSFFTTARQVFVSARGDWQKEQFNDGVLNAYFQSIDYNGRWAAYKGCEVLNKVLGYPNRATDAGHENSSGPRSGLALFFPELKGNSPTTIRKLDEQTLALMYMAEQHGCPLHVEECETLLCDFRSMTHGRYYVGHDIDLMLEGMLRAPVSTHAIIEAGRRRGLPRHYLGELCGWEGRDRAAMTAYAERGAILYRGLNAEWQDAASGVAA